MIIEILELGSIEDCVSSCSDNHFPQGEFSISAKFRMAALRFVNVTEEVMNTFEENSIPKSAKDATKFGITLLKERY